MKTEPRFTLDGIHIRDKDGRYVLFRGCNLGGDSKIPASPAGNPLSGTVSFVGRPFPLEEADDHLSRLAGWGFNAIRMIITWEAVEHEGPGIYDEDYLAYLREVLKKCEHYGFAVFIDPHQDAWSRWSGGDGAPRWTLEAVGIDPDKISATGAAFTIQEQGTSYQPMSWGLNNLRYAAATMSTLFFAGNVFAPGLFVEGVPVQDWLQDHFIDAMKHTARRIKDCDAVIGFGLFNEPHPGFVGLRNLSDHARITARSGSAPAAFDAMAAASGFTRKVGRFCLFGTLPVPGYELLNPAGEQLFREGFACPWKKAGVWDVRNGKPVVLKTDYFSKIPAGNGGEGTPVSFAEQFLKPFQKRFMQALLKKHKQYLFFAEGVPMAERPSWNREDRVSPEGTTLPVVEAFHWYEGMTLLSKKWRPWICADSERGTPVFGRAAVKKSIAEQIGRLASRSRAEGVPAFLGEFGVPFDLAGSSSFQTGDYTKQEEALSLMYDGIDSAFIHSTIWNYSASNTHEQGDSWNTENLSIYSRSSGEGRAVRGFSRPYVMALSGKPLEMRFDTNSAVFQLRWDAVPGTSEIYVPSHWYPDGWETDVLPADIGIRKDPASQRLFLDCRASGVMTLRIQPCKKTVS